MIISVMSKGKLALQLVLPAILRFVSVGIGLPGRLYPVKLAALPPLKHKESEKL